MPRPWRASTKGDSMKRELNGSEFPWRSGSCVGSGSQGQGKYTGSLTGPRESSTLDVDEDSRLRPSSPLATKCMAPSSRPRRWPSLGRASTLPISSHETFWRLATRRDGSMPSRSITSWSTWGIRSRCFEKLPGSYAQVGCLSLRYPTREASARDSQGVTGWGGTYPSTAFTSPGQRCSVRLLG